MLCVFVCVCCVFVCVCVCVCVENRWMVAKWLDIKQARANLSVPGQFVHTESIVD